MALFVRGDRLSDLAGIAAVVTATAVLIAAGASAYVTVKSTRTIKQTNAMVHQIDAAVNGKPPGSTTMVDQVQALTNQAFPKEEVNGDAMLPLLRKLANDVDELKRAVKA